MIWCEKRKKKTEWKKCSRERLSKLRASLSGYWVVSHLDQLQLVIYKPCIKIMKLNMALAVL